MRLRPRLISRSWEMPSSATSVPTTWSSSASRTSVTRLSNDNVQVIYFTEVLEAEDDSVVHRWEWNGTVMAEISFDVRGPRWRVHSSKNLDPRWLGEWTVVTLDSAGNELRRDTFFYTATSEVDAALPASPARYSPTRDSNVARIDGESEKSRTRGSLSRSNRPGPPP